MNTTNFKTLQLEGIEIFYREAGDKNKPVILLLHGFPSSSHMFRNLIDDLSEDYYLIAPDYPGFGRSSSPAVSTFNYSFDNLAHIIGQFIDALKLERFSLYLHDYGGPVGFRIASERPSSIQSLIIQNANAYMEGLGDALNPLVAYIQNQNAETEKGARSFLSPAAIEWLYTDGAEDLSKISPDGYTIDQYYLNRPGNDEIQLALFRDYGSNLPLYEEWQSYFKTHQPATLVVWGENDKLFLAKGAQAYSRDLKKAQVNLLNGGHFLLEEKHKKTASLIKSFLSETGIVHSFQRSSDTIYENEVK